MTITQTMDVEEIKIATDVLVIGGGLAGVKAASEIAEKGYHVILTESGDKIGTEAETGPLAVIATGELRKLQDQVYKVNKNADIEVMTGTRPTALSGLPGDFNVVLTGNDQITELKVGAIVIAGGYGKTSLKQFYTNVSSPQIITQTELEKKLEQAKIKGQTVAFMVGFAQAGNPVIMERTLKSVLALVKEGKNTVYVYAGDLKVASDGLERLYKEGRDLGAIYCKIPNPPAIDQNGDQLKITYLDNVVRQEIELEPDWIVVEEALTANADNDGLAESLRVDLGAGQFLQMENVHRFPVKTNREGIFVIGPSRCIQNLPAAFVDAENVALAVSDLLGDGVKQVPVDKAIVDRKKCTFCLTCYRACPHGAIYWEDKPVISPIACVGCGTCASECPMDAIQIKGYSDSAVMESIKTQAASVNGNPMILAFCCENSAYEAGDMAAVFNMELPRGLRKIKVPCAGKIDINYILSAFIEGADGVLVLTCHNGNCKSERGNIFAKWRVGDVRKKMTALGFEPERLEFATLASNMGRDFQKITVEMATRIETLGRSKARP